MKTSFIFPVLRRTAFASALTLALISLDLCQRAAASAVTAGSRVTFLATADGSPAPTFQWKKDGVEITGASDATLVLAVVSPADAGTYRVTASNIAGSADSADEILTVDSAPLPTAVAPVFNVQPVALVVATSGTTASFSGSATGSPAPTYQWLKNGSIIPVANTENLTLSAVTPADAGTYQLVAANSAGSVTSSAAVLVVNTPPAILVPPTATQSANAGSTLTLSVTVSGLPAPALQWNKNGTAIAGATAADLTLANLGSGDAASYTVTAANAAGSVTSAAAVVVVNTPPVITAQPVATQSVTAGATVTLSVSADGNPAPTYQWSKNGAVLPGATGATLALTGVSAAAAGTYTVVAGNCAGYVTSTPAVVIVNTPPALLSQPPATQTVAAGSAAQLAVTATGSPAPTFQWQKNGTAVAGGTAPTLSFTSVALTDAATYTVVATNAAGFITSAPAILVVTAAPTITQQPVSQTVPTKTNVTFAVTATGYPAPAYQWKKNGTRINGATSATLKLNQVNKSDEAVYAVEVRNTLGTVTSADAKLTLGTAASPTTAGYLAATATAEEDSPPVASVPSRILNVSVRARVGGDNPSLIVGFVIGGDASQPILLRGVGPTLETLGLGDVLRDPTLALYSGQKLTDMNAGWSTAADAAEISRASAVLGAFRLADSSRDAALLPTLATGAYTVELSGPSGHAGLALLEAYAGLAQDSAGLVNLSVRARVGAGEATPTVGFVVSGNRAKHLLIRAVGPTLGTFGLSGVLADPHLALSRNGVAIAANDNWGGGADLHSTFGRVGAFDLVDDNSRDAALLVTLEPGSYSVTATGVGGGTGLALIEIYDVP